MTRRDYGGSILTRLQTEAIGSTREREREKKKVEGLVRDTTVLEGGVIET
jgi:hypothetical protein